MGTYVSIMAWGTSSNGALHNVAVDLTSNVSPSSIGPSEVLLLLRLEDVEKDVVLEASKVLKPSDDESGLCGWDICVVVRVVHKMLPRKEMQNE